MIDALPLTQAPIAVQFHVACAVLALALGPIALFRKSRDRLHRWAGGIWILSMTGVALSSFLISSVRMFGPFSIIHILSVLTLISLVQAFRHARQRRFQEHGRVMRGLYLQALIITGIFTFLPGRKMNEVFFAAMPVPGFWLAAAVGAAIAGSLWLASPRMGLPILRSRKT